MYDQIFVQTGVVTKIWLEAIILRCLCVDVGDHWILSVFIIGHIDLRFTFEL